MNVAKTQLKARPKKTAITKATVRASSKMIAAIPATTYSDLSGVSIFPRLFELVWRHRPVTSEFAGGNAVGFINLLVSAVGYSGSRKNLSSGGKTPSTCFASAMQSNGKESSNFGLSSYSGPLRKVEDTFRPVRKLR